MMVVAIENTLHLKWAYHNLFEAQVRVNKC